MSWLRRLRYRSAHRDHEIYLRRDRRPEGQPHGDGDTVLWPGWPRTADLLGPRGLPSDKEPAALPGWWQPTAPLPTAPKAQLIRPLPAVPPPWRAQ